MVSLPMSQAHSNYHIYSLPVFILILIKFPKLALNSRCSPGLAISPASSLSKPPEVAVVLHYTSVISVSLSEVLTRDQYLPAIGPCPLFTNVAGVSWTIGQAITVWYGRQQVERTVSYPLSAPNRSRYSWGARSLSTACGSTSPGVVWLLHQERAAHSFPSVTSTITLPGSAVPASKYHRPGTNYSPDCAGNSQPAPWQSRLSN